MAQVLPPSFTFAALRDRLAVLGWAETRLPAVLPPILSGEPEAAAFLKEGQRLDYSFNPAIRLRLLDGPVPDGLPSLRPEDLVALIMARDPEQALLGAVAAAELGQGGLRSLIILRAARLPTSLARHALAAANWLAPLCAEAMHFAALAPERQSQILRLALKHKSPDAADLVAIGLSAAPEVAATAMIAAARLGHVALLPAFPRQAKGELNVAIRKLATATLSGQSPDLDASPRSRFWRAVLGQGDPEMDLRLAPLVEPSPEAQIAEIHGGIPFRRIEAVPHWLGDPDIAGTARSVTPRRFLIAESPLLACKPSVALTALTDLCASTGLHLRLPTDDELHCGLRGTDGRVHPAGQPARSPWQSPWGLISGLAEGEFCTQGYIIHTTRTDRPTASSPAGITDDPAGLRPVIEIE